MRKTNLPFRRIQWLLLLVLASSGAHMANSAHAAQEGMGQPTKPEKTSTSAVKKGAPKPLTLGDVVNSELSPASDDAARTNRAGTRSGLAYAAVRVAAIYGSDGQLRTDLTVGADRWTGLRLNEPVGASGYTVAGIKDKCVSLRLAAPSAPSPASGAPLRPANAAAVSTSSASKLETYCWTGIEPAPEPTVSAPVGNPSQATPGNLRSAQGLPAGAPALPVAAGNAPLGQR
jgi:hypothetical protein